MQVTMPVVALGQLAGGGFVVHLGLITSGGLSTNLANKPSCRAKRNFEAVIETQIRATAFAPSELLVRSVVGPKSIS